MIVYWTTTTTTTTFFDGHVVDAKRDKKTMRNRSGIFRLLLLWSKKKN